ncbi:GerMN domain-containing protein [Ilumatobacter sp.]|uniref:GerMN domain-containing protein n=1 Tax=Ilumatobacter sp. TaxID=1967498 RepID=UPI003C65EE1F
MSNIIRRAAWCVAFAAVASCGVPTGPESFEAIGDAEIPNRLADTTSTTSTTTTTTTTTLPDTPQTTTTTSIAPATQFVEVFFLSRDQLRAVEVEAPSPVADTDLILLLERGPGPSGGLLTNLVEEGLIIDTTSQGGILTIDLDESILDDIPSRDQREAIAQMVLTFLYGLGGVGQAVFTFNGGTENVAIPTGDRLLTNEPVSVDDYATMRVNVDPNPELDPNPDEVDTGGELETVDGTTTTTAQP